MNSLEKSASSYLRSAMHQPVHWREWGPEAFTLAAEQNKPILLDIGAVWCHWCHVMDRESYEDPLLAELINKNFVPVKVDRDERPDVDSRYQSAVSAMSGQGGWPLTAILTPDGKPFFGGTYFPREEQYGRPGMETVLRTIAEAWKSRREEAIQSANSALAAIEHNESFRGRGGELSMSIVKSMATSALDQFDPIHGGFDSQPKFPHPSTLDLLLDLAARDGDEAARHAALLTLEKMARGGVYDQLAGGFHRYSVDERWVVPHFEKMLYDNSELLKNYVHAFQSFGSPAMARVARDIIRWMDEWLTDRELGGFYSSQDADINLDDDGDYFTWTRDEAADVLSADEMAAASLYFHIGEIGDMHHNPRKNVLHLELSMEDVATKLKKPLDETQALVATAKEKLYAARKQRPTPYIDRTIYTGWNALAVSAYLEAASALDLPEVREFALLTLDRLLADGWDPEAGLTHVIAYPGGQPARRIEAMLDDYAFLASACLDGWTATGRMQYYRTATKLAERMISDFADPAEGGFFDSARSSTAPLGALAARRKPLQDSPTPAGNSAAASVLVRLEALTGREEFRAKAEDTLKAFAGIVSHFGLYAGTYALALERFLLPPVEVVVIGEDAEAKEMAKAAIVPFAVNKTVLSLTHAQVREGLPEFLEETLPRLPQLDQKLSFAVVCQGMTCQPPVTSVQNLQSLLTEPQRSSS